MNLPVEILFVDDDLDNLTPIRGRLTRTLERLGCEPSFELEDDFDTACDRLIRRRGKPYEVVIVDLLQRISNENGGRDVEQEPRGLDVLTLAREASPNTVVVAITQGSPNQPDLQNQASEAGADIVLLRNSLRNTSAYGGPQQLAKEVYDKLCERGVLNVGPKLVYGADPGINSIVYEAGEPALRVLLTDLLAEHGGRPQSVRLTYVAPGASGAQVLGAEATLMDGTQRFLLAKISRDLDALLQELDNASRAVGVYGGPLVVPYLQRSRPTRPRNGWSAIGLAFVENAVTLRTWLARAGSAADVPTVMSRLFLNRGLASTQRTPVHSTPMVSLGETLRLPPFRQVLVREALRRFTPALAHRDAAAITDDADVIRVVEAFVFAGMIGDIELTGLTAEALMVLGHGDLHGGNILVSHEEHPQPVVIDLAAFGPHHWALDAARLVVDVLLQCVDTSIESYLWRRFAAWRQLAYAVGDFADIPDDLVPGNSTALTALRWIIAHRREVIPPVEDLSHSWEWHAVLAEQFLRRTYNRDLSPAKRTVALVSAYDQLERVRRAR